MNTALISGAAGFVGFGLGAMPVGLSAMKRLTLKYGDAPRAFLVITLAASLFTDTANAPKFAAKIQASCRFGKTQACDRGIHYEGIDVGLG